MGLTPPGETYNVLTGQGGRLAPTSRLLWTLAVFATLVVGYGVAARSADSPIVAGAAIGTGFLPLMIVGSFILEVNFSTGDIISISPQTLPSSVFAGIVFPVVCGATGELLYRRLVH